MRPGEKADRRHSLASSFNQLGEKRVKRILCFKSSALGTVIRKIADSWFDAGKKYMCVSSVLMSGNRSSDDCYKRSDMKEMIVLSFSWA